MEKRYDVIIAGGGPVGVALAVELGLRGISCAVIERRTGLQRLPKGQNLTHRTMEHFWSWGIADELRAARTMPAGYTTGNLTAYMNLMSDFYYPSPQRETVRPYYFQDNERLPQYRTEAVLRARMAQLPTVSSWSGWSFETLEQDEHGVRLEVVEEGGDGRGILTADYLVGCDGAHSAIRDQVGIQSAGTKYDQLMVLAVFRSRELHEGLRRLPDSATYLVLRPELRGYWQFFGRVDLGEQWFFHAPVPPQTTRDNFDFKALLEQAAGFPFECEFDHVGFWDLGVAVAEQYQAGRVFIAGDAAHSHPPYGGFGLNNGLEDARNLGWKLAAAVQGWGSSELLASYSEERRPVFFETANDFIAKRIEADRAFLERHDLDRDAEDFVAAWRARTSRSGSYSVTYEPNYEGSSVVLGPPDGRCSAHGSHSLKARPGHHLSPMPFASGQNAFEALGPGFTLLALGTDTAEADAAIAAFQAAASELGAPFVAARDDDDAAAASYGARLILARPDNYVVWTGNTTPEDALAVLGTAVGRAPAMVTA